VRRPTRVETLQIAPQQVRRPTRVEASPSSSNSLNVNYQAQPVFLDRGQTIHPLCDKPATLECVAQWSQQAVPLVS